MKFHYKGLNLLLAFSFLLLWGCAGEQPVKKKVPLVAKRQLQKPVTKPKRKPFDDENYTKKELKRLKLLTSRYPTERKVALSWYRLGNYYLNLRNYRASLDAFEKVVAYSKDEPFYFDSYIKMGISQVYLKKYREADATLLKAYQKAKSSKDRSVILYHLGENNYLRSDFSTAVKWLVGCWNTSGAYRKQAGRRTRLILHNFLSESELLDIVERYKNSFPSDVAYLELSEIYRRNADLESLAQIERRMVRDFPGLKKSMEVEEESAPAGEITISALLPLSGERSKSGNEALRGIQLAFSSNQHLIKSMGIRLMVKDTKSKTSATASAVHQLGNDNSVITVIGPFSDLALDAALIASEQYNLPILSPYDTFVTSYASLHNFYPIGLTGKEEGKVMAEFGVDQNGFFRMAMLYPEGKYGKRVSSAFMERANTLGAGMAVSIPYQPEATDFGTEIRKLGGMKDSEIRKIVWKYVEEEPTITPEEINARLEMRFQNNLTTPYIVKYRELPLTKDNFSVGLRTSYDALFLPGNATAVGLILPELAFYNIRGVKILGSAKYASPELIALAKRYADGVIFPVEFFEGSHRFTVRRFVKNFENAFGVKPGVDAARAYDATNMLLLLISNGADTRRRIVKSLNALPPLLGITGEFSGGLDEKVGKSPFLMTIEEGNFIEYGEGNNKSHSVE